MSPTRRTRKKPGPKPKTKRKSDEELQRKHTKFHFPYLCSFEKHHLIYNGKLDETHYLTNDVVFAKYKQWLNCMGPGVVSSQLKNEIYIHKHQTAFMKQLLQNKTTRVHWDIPKKRASMEVINIHRRDYKSQTLTIKSFTEKQIKLEDLPIYRKISTLEGAGSGMFSKRMILSGEIVCEYDGTVQQVTDDEFQLLQTKFKNEGNGIIELTTGKPFTEQRSQRRDAYVILNPYKKNAKDRSLDDAIGVWANHCPLNIIGCNMKLVSNLQFGFNRRYFLEATSTIPGDCELRWDYGIRDPTISWTMP